MTNILLLTDFSESATVAIEFALNTYATHEETHFFLLHVINNDDDPITNLTSSGNENGFNNTVNDKKDKIKKLANDLTIKHKASVSPIISTGNFIEVIKKVINQKSITLVFAGFNGANTLQEKVFGSNTLKIIKNIRTDFLIVPENYNNKKIESVLLLLDEDDNLNEVLEDETIATFLEKATLNITRIINKKIECNIANKDQEIIDKHQSLNCNYSVFYKIPIHLVKSFWMQTKQIDMIILIGTQKNFFEKLFKELDTVYIDKTIKKPLLITY